MYVDKQGLIELVGVCTGAWCVCELPTDCPGHYLCTPLCGHRGISKLSKNNKRIKFVCYIDVFVGTNVYLFVRSIVLVAKL